MGNEAKMLAAPESGHVMVVVSKWTRLGHKVALACNTFLIFCLFLCLVSD